MTADRTSTSGSGGASGKNRRIVLLALLVLAGGLGLGIYQMLTFNPNYVVDVTRGDILLLKSGEGVRMIGVECSPVDDPQVGAPASAFTTQCALNRQVRIEQDVQPKTLEGSILAYVFVERDGKEMFLNEELLRRGLAKLDLMYPNLKYRRQLEAAQAEAKEKKAGLWNSDYRPPHE